MDRVQDEFPHFVASGAVSVLFGNPAAGFAFHTGLHAHSYPNYGWALCADPISTILYETPTGPRLSAGRKVGGPC